VGGFRGARKLDTNAQIFADGWFSARFGTFVERLKCNVLHSALFLAVIRAPFLILFDEGTR
jgi:hypothetical protein